MTPEAQRIAIAKACGDLQPIKCKPSIEQIEAALADKRPMEITLMPDGEVRSIRDYTNDLNAMNDAEKLLNQKQQIRYASLLQGALWTVPELNGFYLMHKSAAQRAEAFLRTLGLWQE